MLPYRDSRLTYIALGIFFLIVLSYAYYEARGLLFGPTIIVASGVIEVHEPFVMIQGRAERISSLSMNGKTVPVTESGAFEEPYLLNLGYNRVVLDASDKYGRTRRQAIEIIYTLSTTTAQTAAGITTTDSTSSPQTASSTQGVAQ
ncbi:hypothetical protein HY971_02305 [Candidatus Kaiserbacteria bacterium]|nr:hypothetical protein [Candidatus Kaiserbacteria bacterium]